MEVIEEKFPGFKVGQIVRCNDTNGLCDDVIGTIMNLTDYPYAIVKTIYDPAEFWLVGENVCCEDIRELTIEEKAEVL